MTRLEDRQILVRDIEQACADGARLAPACALAGIDVRTLRRWKVGDGLLQGDRRPDADRPIPSHARRRRRGLSRPWPTKVSTSPVSPAFIVCCAHMAR